MSTPADPARTPTGARTLEAGALLIGVGALLLLVSLFLEWYQPGAEAWDVFEVWDLVLAALAIGALVAVASRLGYGPPRPAAWLIGPAIAALVIVVYALLDPPPVAGVLPDGDPGTGLWLALVAAVLMTVGAVLSVARISIAITAAGPAAHDGGHAEPVAGDATEPRRGGLFARRGDAPPADETAPTAGHDAAGVTPTEPTRRL